MDLSTPLQFVKGIGPARGTMLAAKGLATVADLLYYAPFRYEDRTNVKTIAQLVPGEKAAVFARVAHAKFSRFKQRGNGLLEVALQDGSGAELQARWFHGERYGDSLVPDAQVVLFGKVELDRSAGERLMVQPEVEFPSGEDEDDETLHSGRIVAVYEAASRVNTRAFRKLIHGILKQVEMPGDALPESVRQRIGLPDLATAIPAGALPPAWNRPAAPECVPLAGASAAHLRRVLLAGVWAGS